VDYASLKVFNQVFPVDFEKKREKLKNYFEKTYKFHV